MPLALVKHGAGVLIHRFKALTFRPYVVRKTLAGEELLILIGDIEGRYQYDRAHAWPELAFVATELLRPGDVVADCGANHGVTGVLFARKVGRSGRVVGFEPNPANAAIARRNARLNRVKHFEVREEVVGRSPGSAFFRPEMNGFVSDAADPRAVVVPRVTLDEVFADRAPDFVKVDVEGHELEVLAGARRVFASLPSFDIEFHVEAFDDPRSSIAELVSLLPFAEYETYVQKRIDGPIVPAVVDEALISELAGYRNVHLFGKARARRDTR